MSLFVVGIAASGLAEYLCGTGSEKCPINWSGLYGSDPANYTKVPGHCSSGTVDSGLGDPMLSVSSLLIVIPIIYLQWSGPLFTPIAAVFLGIASFLFHAANTKITFTLDFIGLNLLAPAILSDIIRRYGYSIAAFILFGALLTTTILVRLLVKDSFPQTNQVFNTYIFIAQPTLTVAILTVAYLFDYIKDLWPGALFTIGGSIALIVANNVDSFWGCVETQLIEPHFWGHLLVGIGATLFCRAIGMKNDYTKLI